MNDQRAIDWRSLFDELRIEWHDRGPNTAKGCVSIQCPWCGDADPSWHLLIRESDNSFRCLRTGGEHWGRNPTFLLRALRVSPQAAPQHIARHQGDLLPARVLKPVGDRKALQRQWNRFLPAAESEECLDYLQLRGFDDPPWVCRRYDLRYAPEGPWAAKLLFPVGRPDRLGYGWTARDVRPDPLLRYKTKVDDGEAAVYTPRPLTGTVVLFEGPFDGLKAAVVTEYTNISVIALLGLTVPFGRGTDIAAIRRRGQDQPLASGGRCRPEQTQRRSNS